ncbi:TonB-dependent receptor domain-containing protein [Piscinibacter sakaiensis]|uniref:TonB-dependent receptor domain-containing protein n=1 Tax=Piscinibacter sakaiensis TaxID=1547922 RepID=UPI003AABB9DD
MPRITKPVCRHGSAAIRVVTSLSLLTAHALVWSADPVAPRRYAFAQPAQQLVVALRSIERQTGTSVAFDPTVVHGRMAPALSGQMSVDQAVTRAVDGSGLVVVTVPGGGIVVRTSEASSVAGQGGDAGEQPASSTGPTAPSRSEADVSADAPSRQAPQKLGRVEVTGSRLKRIDVEGPMPVTVYRKEDIENSGQPSIAKFLGTLNEVSMGSGEGTHSGTAGLGTVQLRGLPLGSTAVLLNGRKLQAVGSSFASYFNLNLIPIGAIERIEVVPVGSSAIYGGDALAGVVNIILKNSLDGFSLDTRLGGGSGFGDGSVSFAAGKHGDAGSVMLLGSYSKATPLNMSERAFFLDTDYRRFGGVDARTMNCAPGTVSSATSANLPGLNATTAGIPANAAGGQPLTIASFAGTAGQPNRCSDAMNGNGNALVHGSETLGLHAAAEHRIGKAWTAFGEFTAAEDRVETNFAGMKLNNVLVPAGNPYNPFGVPVRVTSTLGLENGSTGAARPTRYTRMLGGVKGELPGDWDLEATVSSSRDKSEQRSRNLSVNAAARTAALASTNAATALNPFTGGRAASDEVLRSIWGDLVRQSEGRKDLLTTFVRGPVASLPAGSLDAVIGAEMARDHYESQTLGSPRIEGSRSSRAVYAEMRAPLLRRVAAGGRSGELAALTVAARSDHYAQVGSAGTYQAGLEVRPTNAWLVRASAATSFKPPTLDNALVPEAALPAQAYGLVDPARNNETISTGEVVRTTNPSLQPERGKAFALGVNWEPQNGIRFGATAWRIRADRMITLLLPQVILANEAQLPGVVVREPTVNGVPGRLVRLTFAESNLGYLESSGVDLEGHHSWRSPVGTWTLGASATRVTQYDVKLTPTSAVDSRLGRRHLDYWAPKWKGRVFGSFAAQGWSLGIAGRYVGSYKDAGTSQRKLGNSMIFDLSGRIDLKKLGASLGSATSAALSFGVVNIANRLPEFAEASPYFDQTQADWRGRTASVRLSVDW